MQKRLYTLTYEIFHDFSKEEAAYNALKEYDTYAEFLESTGRKHLVNRSLMEFYGLKHGVTVDEMKAQWRNLKPPEYFQSK